MTRPQSETEYLARMPVAPVSGLSRRALIGGGLALSVLGLSGCGGFSDPVETGEVSFGNKQADPVPRAAIEAVAVAFEDAHPDLHIAMNTVAHSTFQENIGNYLQGAPDDVFGWFAGYRARFFAEKGLVTDLSDLYGQTAAIPESLRKACSTVDDRQVILPSTYYPWVMLYRRSVWEERGYEVPQTLDQLTELCRDMEDEGLVPLAFADKDGWEAMGMFDILNLRVNGYDYHISLMAGEETWTSAQVAAVFDQWRELLPFHQPNALGRNWQEAALGLQQRQAGMFYFGTFAAQQFAQGEEQEDLGFFAFPEIDPAIGAGAIEAPTDGFMMRSEPRNEAGAREWLGYLGTAEAQDILVQADPSVVAVSEEADVSAYTRLQTEMLQLLQDATDVSQFLDRDSRPDFASTVVGPALQRFLRDPGDTQDILDTVEAQKRSIFAS